MDRYLKLPYRNSFYPYKESIERVQKLLSEYDNDFESCNESILVKGKSISVGCVSKKILDLLGIDIKLSRSSNQRKGCLCPRNKTELLENKRQFSHSCLYCYWNNC